MCLVFSSLDIIYIFVCVFACLSLDLPFAVCLQSMPSGSCSRPLLIDTQMLTLVGEIWGGAVLYCFVQVSVFSRHCFPESWHRSFSVILCTSSSGSGPSRVFCCCLRSGGFCPCSGYPYSLASRVFILALRASGFIAFPATIYSFCFTKN